jgi:hypothetical protein
MKKKKTGPKRQVGVPRRVLKKMPPDIEELHLIRDKFENDEELTSDEREKLCIGAYRFNQAKCLKCDQIVRSKNRHDYKMCKCKNLSVDGGTWYLKRALKDATAFEDLSIRYKDAY